MAACEAADVELDAVLLKRLAWAVTSAAPAEQQRLMAAMTAILEKAEAANELDREALAALPAGDRGAGARGLGGGAKPGRQSLNSEQLSQILTPIDHGNQLNRIVGFVVFIK